MVPRKGFNGNQENDELNGTTYTVKTMAFSKRCGIETLKDMHKIPGEASTDYDKLFSTRQGRKRFTEVNSSMVQEDLRIIKKEMR